MRSQAVLLVKLATYCFAITPVAFASEEAAVSSTATQQHRTYAFPSVPEVHEVKTRARNGRLEHFDDAANRTFVVRYREDGKVESVGAVRGRHASDIHRINYAPTGQISEVLFANGYALYFVYADNGTHVIRDQFGGVLTRNDSTKPAGTQSLHSDPSGRLQPTLARLDALLAAASQ